MALFTLQSAFILVDFKRAPLCLVIQFGRWRCGEGKKRLGSKSCGSETAASGIRRRNTDRHSDVRAMAATGGGKIRSRRYHIASKPYAKSKQVNWVAVFALAVQIEDVTPGALPPTLLPCYCFVGDIFMACR